MNGNIFARLTGTKRNLLALLASSAMLTAGCANMATTASGVGALTTSATLGGKVHGGNQPVSGAAVTLYYAAQSLYGAPILAATTTTSTDGTGSFSFIKNPTPDQAPSGNTFSCPTAGDPLVYVVAKGGNTLNNGDSNVHNDAAAFIGVYGVCSQIASAGFLDLTEVTTVATLAAYQQYFDPSNYGLSSDGILQTKIAIVIAAKTVALLADTTNGTSRTSTIVPAATGNGTNGVTGVTVTATPETAKLNTLANALAACVNNASSSATACSTLFASATPPSPALTNKPGGTVFAPATDVVQAAYYILTNPTNGGSTNLSNVFGLSAAAGAPYQPTLASAPTDWTIAINYASSSTCSSSSGNFINQPYDINVDDQNNIWIANSQSTNGNLSQLSNSGAPMTCVFLSGGSNGGGVIDSGGNIWFATTASNNIYRYSTGFGSAHTPQGIVAFPTAAAPLGVTADGQGNVYFTASSTGSLYQIPGASTASAAVTPIQISGVVGPNPVRLMPDFNGTTNPSNIWVTSGAGYVSRVSPSSGPNPLNGYSTTTFNVGTSTYGLAVTLANTVLVSSGGSANDLTYLTGSGTSYSPAWTTAGGFAGINNPTGISLDGRNNVWVPNNTNSGSNGSVSQVSLASNALSPTATGFQKSSTFLSSGRASVVDNSGNVWIVGDGPSYLTEIVGAGVPMYQPAAGLSNGRFQTIP